MPRASGGDRRARLGGRSRESTVEGEGVEYYTHSFVLLCVNLMGEN